MKPSSHPFYTRGPFGLHYEKVLKPTIEKLIGEPITKTEVGTDTMDFYSEHYFVELKTRSDIYHPSQWFIKRDGWLLPYCKMVRAREEAKKGKRCIFFYFWTAGKTLWRWDYNEEELATCKADYPEWHRDQQRQVYIPEKFWRQVC